jgi:hypothetical protein
LQLVNFFICQLRYSYASSSIGSDVYYSTDDDDNSRKKIAM